MAAVTQVIPNMLGGVSQQPDPIKLPGQVRKAVNAYLDPTFGCRKRPGTKFIKELGTDIPAGAKWLSIFRDKDERYIVACYHDSGDFIVRVWEADTGIERNVTIAAGANQYFAGASLDNISSVTLGDFTLISSADKVITAGSGTPVPKETAFVVVEQLGYNTTYGVYLDKDGASGATKQYRATSIEVSPGSYEEADAGLCSANSTVTHTVTSGAKTGLSFQLSNQCAAFLKYTDSYSASAARIVTKAPGAANSYSYTYGDLTGTVVIKVKKNTVTVKEKEGTGIRKGTRFTTSQGDIIEITAERLESAQVYVSRYTTSVLLKNGGVGWRVGDQVVVTQGGDSFTVTVTGEAFDYVYASDGSATYTTPVDTAAGTLSIDSVTASLAATIDGFASYEATSVGNVIRVRRTDTRSFNLSVRGGSLNNAISTFKGVANDIAALPTQCWDGEVIKVRNTQSSAADDYYVKFVTDTPGIPGTGHWVETVKPGIVSSLNTETMPCALIRESDGDFTFGPLTTADISGGWKPRVVGDDLTNPLPSFVGSTITRLLFYNNRLGILSGQNLILGQPGDYFNFFTKSAISLSDADPIDIEISSSKPSVLRAAVSTQSGLVVFSESAQYLVKSDEAKFSSQTIEIKNLCSYPSFSRALPQNAGVSIFFAVEADTFSKVLEMAVDSVGERPVIADDTRIIPQLIPRDLEWMTASQANDMVLLGGKTREIFVFKYFNQGSERKIAGWSTWLMPGGVVFVDNDVDTFYLVQRNVDSTFLASAELLDDSADAGVDTGFSIFTPRLDNYITSDLITEEVIGADARLYFPAGAFVDGFIPVFISTDDGEDGVILRPDIESDVDGYYITVDADLVASSALYTIGLQYDMEVELPSFYTTIQQRPDQAFPPMVENVYLNLYYSGRYMARVVREGYDDIELDLSVGRADIYEADLPLVVENASIPIPVFCRGDQARVTVIAEDPTPSSLAGYTWQGHYNTRGINLLQ